MLEIAEPRRVGRDAGLQHPEGHRIVEGNRAHARGIEGRGAQGDEATVGVTDEVDRAPEALEELIDHLDVVEEAKGLSLDPRRGAAGSEEIGDDHPPAALPEVLGGPPPLIAGHPAAVEEDRGLALANVLYMEGEISPDPGAGVRFDHIDSISVRG